MAFLNSEDIIEISNFLRKEKFKFEGKTILLTGGRGFLGRYFTDIFFYFNKKVFSKPCKLILIDNMITSGNMGSKIPDEENFKFIKHDITKPINFNEKIDFIIYAAGIASPYYYKKWPLQTLEVATIGLKAILELGKKNLSRVIFFSSSEIYGNPSDSNIPTMESYNGNISCLGPRACYDESKRLGETLVQIYSSKFGLDASIIRPFNVYGPGMQSNDYRVLPNFISKIIKEENLQIYGNGNQTRTYCYVTDALNGFFRVLLNGNRGEPYNIGNTFPEISVIKLVETFKDVFPNKKIIFNIIPHPDSYPADEPQRRCPDITKANNQLNYFPKIELKEGLKRFYNWAEQNYK